MNNMDMSSPVPPPQFVSPPPPPPPPPPYVLGGSNSAPFWPGPPIENQQHPRPVSRLDVPPFKRPRSSEDSPPNPVPNLNRNTRMPPPPRGVGRIFFKTRPCERFREGTCPYGTNCNFAHGIEDIRKPPPNWQEIAGFRGDDRIGNGNWDNEIKVISRHRLCRHFFSGNVCPYGNNCSYLHGDPGNLREEIENSRESSAINISTAGATLDKGARSDQSDNVITVSSNLDAAWMNSKPVIYKTRICKKWEASGFCSFGDRCHFAHGLAELKGGHNEVEMVNVGTAPPKPLPNPVNDASLKNTVAGGSCKKPVLNKFLLKWKGPEKISRIYADWIDDITPKSSPSKQEN